jgi:hypothetical protein
MKINPVPNMEKMEVNENLIYVLSKSYVLISL